MEETLGLVPHMGYRLIVKEKPQSEEAKRKTKKLTLHCDGARRKKYGRKKAHLMSR